MINVPGGVTRQSCNDAAASLDASRPARVRSGRPLPGADPDPRKA